MNRPFFWITSLTLLAVLGLGACRSNPPVLRLSGDPPTLLPDPDRPITPLVRGTRVLLILQDERVLEGKLVRLTRRFLYGVHEQDTFRIRREEILCVAMVELNPPPRFPGRAPSPLLIWGILHVYAWAFSALFHAPLAVSIATLTAPAAVWLEAHRNPPPWIPRVFVILPPKPRRPKAFNIHQQEMICRALVQMHRKP
ncbi:MAG: hypothetical protein L3J76_05125 [Candidatus Hydrothermae bacterium]|nr:hypothetical protein [Candidatus Hydrothermae bacterium]